MRYSITIKGRSPIIMHNGEAGLEARSPANLEKSQISRKRGSNRTETDDLRLQELECQTSFWLNSKGSPTIPENALRRSIETGARKLKQGTQVREGLVIEKTESFDYDKSLGTTLEELCKSTQFTTPVVVQRNKIHRTRAKFDEWGCTFTVDVDPELVDESQLHQWLDIAGRRIGIGDWRPEKSGVYGRFAVEKIQQLSE